MREKSKGGKAPKETDKSRVYERFFQIRCLESSDPCLKTAVRTASLADERHFSYFDIFLWETCRTSIFVPGSTADSISKSSFPRSDPLIPR